MISLAARLTGMTDRPGTHRLFVVGRELPSDLDDGALVAAFVQRAPRAPEALWNRYQPLVRSVLSRSLGPGADVDDLVQETFIRLFRKLPTLQNPSALRSFVLTITTRVLQTELRVRWFRRWLGLADDGQLPERPAADADLEAREALSRFYGLLDGLNAQHRTAFVLRYVQGLELTEVATALGISLATVKRWLPRIEDRLYARAGRDPMLRSYLDPTQRREETP